MVALLDLPESRVDPTLQGVPQFREPLRRVVHIDPLCPVGRESRRCCLGDMGFERPHVRQIKKPVTPLGKGARGINLSKP